ncbi:MAG: PLP-dependent aminotransferase family protein [Verrucomicrobiae bacterium]|nr:PLP-dependent aminotransferase family protein [Verrucomicrobiae bacterium]
MGSNSKTALSALGRRTGEPPISWLMQAALARDNLISLAAGFTDTETLPVAETRAALNELLRSSRSGRAALQYGSTIGDPQLRQLTAQRFARLDGLRPGPRSPWSPERLLITHGSQQLLYLLTEALCDPGDIALVEDPTYFVFLGILQSRGVQARGVRLENDGLDLAHLRAVLEALRRRKQLPRVKLLYLVSYFQNPTGVTTAFAKKRAALALLREFERDAGHPIYLVEDAAYRELRFAGGDEPSALAVRGFARRVVYAGTYSKPFATGVRVGFGVLPEPLFSAVVRIKGNHDFGTSNLLQHLMARALASGRYDRHLALLRRRYAHKARVMQQALEKHFPRQVRWRAPHGGLYFWARLPRGLKCGLDSALFKAALEREVLYVPGALCYADDPTRRKPDNEMRLSFGHAPERELREGIRRLGEVLRDQLAG